MKNKKIEEYGEKLMYPDGLRKPVDEPMSGVNSLTERVEGMEKAYDDLRVEFFHNLPENIINIEKLAERVDTHSIQINKLAKAIYHIDDLVTDRRSVEKHFGIPKWGEKPEKASGTTYPGSTKYTDKVSPNIVTTDWGKKGHAEQSPQKPEANEEYWYVGDDGFFNAESFIWLGSGDSTDRKLYELGNCFKTKKQAEAAAERVRAALRPTKETEK